MATPSLYVSLITAWPIVITTMAIGRATLMTPSLSWPEMAGWAFAGAAPVIMFALLNRSRATQSVAQVLYDAEQTGRTPAVVPVVVSRG